MQCIKTGFHALTPHGYLYGDAFQSERGVLLLRICQISPSPLSTHLHFTINTWSQWFDEFRTSMEINSTMVCEPANYMYHGYEGLAT